MRHTPGYLPTDRTRYKLHIAYCPAGTLALCNAATAKPRGLYKDLEAAQLAYLDQADELAAAGWRIVSAMVFDEQGQHVANIGSTGALWDTHAPLAGRKPLAPPPERPSYSFAVSLTGVVRVEGRTPNHAKERLEQAFGGSLSLCTFSDGTELTGPFLIVGLDMAAPEDRSQHPCPNCGDAAEYEEWTKLECGKVNSYSITSCDACGYEDRPIF